MFAFMATVTVAVVHSSPFKSVYWDNVSDSYKAEILTHDFSNEPELNIGLIILREQVMQDFWGDDWDEQGEEWTDSVLEVVLNKWPDREALFVGVLAYQSAYFWPSKFAFTQENAQYNLRYGDSLAIEENSPFSGGEMKEGVFAVGFIAIPHGIDLSEPFTIWYGDYSDNMGPLD